MNAVVLQILSDRALRRKIQVACEKAGQPLTPQAIFDWKKLKQGVPAARVTIVSRVLNLPPHRIRPDIFPPPKRKTNGG
jgi:hypothetical protein